MPTMLQINKALAKQAVIGYRYYYDGYLECLEDNEFSDETRDYAIYYFPVDMNFEEVEHAITNPEHMSQSTDRTDTNSPTYHY